MLHKKIKFNKFTDGRGDLIPLEFGKNFKNADIPFDVKRCYFISLPTNDNDTVRGKHAHINLEQVLICMNGSFQLDIDNGVGQKESIILNENSTGIYIKGLIWRELRNFSDNCVILVLASEHYDEADYIRNYQNFLIKSQKNLTKKVSVNG